MIFFFKAEVTFSGDGIEGFSSVSNVPAYFKIVILSLQVPDIVGQTGGMSPLC